MKARDNPYRVDRQHQLAYRPAGAVEEALGHWDSIVRRGAIVGPHGTGKTTLLGEIETALVARGWKTSLLRLSADRRATAVVEVSKWLESTPQDRVLLLDGAEQLSQFRWRAFLKRAANHAGLIITTHRAGRLPTLYETPTRPTLLTDLVLELSGRQLAEGEARELWAKQQGNVRDCLRELYDNWTGGKNHVVGNE